MSLKVNLCSVVLIGLHFDAKDFAGKGGGADDGNGWLRVLSLLRLTAFPT